MAIIFGGQCNVLAQTGGLLMWYDASDPNGDGSIPSNGSSLATWVDKSGNRLNGNQSNGSQQAVFYQVAQSGKPGLYFTHDLSTYYDTDPVDLTDSCTYFCAINSQSYTNYAVFDIATATAPEFHFNAGTNQYSGGNYDGIADRGFQWESSASFEPHIFCFRYDATSGFAQNFIDDIAFTPVTNANVSAAGLIARRIGGHPVAPVMFEGYIFELCVYAGALIDGQITQNLRYLGNKWGTKAP